MLSVLQVVLSALFAAVVYVCLASFGGEFLILAERTWALIAFAVFLPAAAVYGLVSAIRGYAGKALPSLPFAVWNLALGILLLVLCRYLVLWVVDQISVPELVILSLPFIGYSALFIGDSLRYLVQRIRDGRDGGLTRGLPAAGAIFFFLFAVFGTTLIFWNPRWSTGVDRMALFAEGMLGRGYRIPSLLPVRDRAGREILLAFAESRADAMLDWGDIDLVMRRSADGGRTWSDIRVLVDAGNRTAGNPCPVFDRVTGTVWLPYCVDNKRVFMMSSRDSGLTWSRPVEITGQIGLVTKCKDTPLCMEYCTGPGKGIQLKSGRLIIPSFFIGPSRARGAHVVYSDDHGATWRRGADLKAGEEPQAIETRDGILYLNCRYKRGESRYIGLSRDGGLTWYAAYRQTDLPEAETQASLVRFSGMADGKKSRILFSNPNFFSRGHMTLRMSYDEGRTWPVGREIYSGPSCYSQIAVLSDRTILLLFEAGKYDYRETITLSRVDLGWLTEGRERPEDK
jgi:sialidase-1